MGRPGCVISVLISIMAVIKANHESTTLPPELLPEEGIHYFEEQDYETPEDQYPASRLLRSGPTDYGSYQYQDYSAVPIPDVYKNVIVKKQIPKKYTIANDNMFDYEDTDLLFDSQMMNDPMIDTSVYDNYNPLGNYGRPYMGGGYLKPYIKAPIIKAPLVKKPLAMNFQGSSKSKEISVRDIQAMLKMLLPLFKGANMPVRARLQFNQGGLKK